MKLKRISILIIIAVIGVLLLIGFLFLLKACASMPQTEKPPIFESGVYDGYQYVPDNWGGNSNVAFAMTPLPTPTYKHLLGIRNEENECAFDTVDDVYVNASLGFYKEKNCTQPPFGNPISSVEIELYVINHISDATDYNNSRIAPDIECFSDLTPIKVISDYYNTETESLNPAYGCFENQAKGGKYVDYEHHVRLTVPNNVFYFDDGYITVVAVRMQKIGNENDPDYNFLTAKISYEKKDGKIILLNYKEIEEPVLNHVEHKQSSQPDSLGYDGGNLYIRMTNVVSAKIDNAYFAKYFDRSSARYLVKIEGVVYYKEEIHQTYWKKADVCDPVEPFAMFQSPNGYVDPEELFTYMSSFRAPEYITTLQTDYGLIFTEEEKMNFINNFGHLTLLMRATPDKMFHVSYFADGWIKGVWGMGDIYADIPKADIDYHLDPTWETTRIDPLRIMEKPLT